MKTIGLPVATTEELEGEATEACECIGKKETIKVIRSGEGYISVLNGKWRLRNYVEEIKVDNDDEMDTDDQIAAQKYEAKKHTHSATISSDPYELLGLQKQRALATEAELKLAYKNACLNYHPDKCGGDDSRFKAVALAWETLSSPEKRRCFDSIDPSF